MKSRKPNRTIEEIYQDKFRDFEQTPREGFWPRFERVLRVREFLHFNPGKFNIFYLGAIVAGIAAITLSGLNSDNRADENNSNIITSARTLEPVGRTIQDESPSPVNQSASKGSAEASGRVTSINPEKAGEDSTKPVTQRQGDIIIKSLKIDNAKIENDINITDKDILDNNELIKPAPSALFDVDYSRGCVPMKVKFNNLSMNFDSCLWEFGDGGYSTEREPVWIFDEDGEYKVKLLVFGSNDQIASSGSEIMVYPLPLAKFEVNNGDPMLPDEQVMFYNYSENSVEWRWDFGDGEKSFDYEPVHQYSKFDSYSVKLVSVSEFGCMDSLIITDAFGENSCFLKFPNAFIPNDGGPTGGYYSNRTDIESEVFHPAWSGVTEYNLKIFNRSGVTIFESNDISVGWDGYYRGQKVDPGVYIWKVRGVFKNGDPFVQGGDVTLLPRR